MNWYELLKKHSLSLKKFTLFYFCLMIVYLFLILGLRIVLRAEVGEVDLETTESVIWPEEKEDVSCAIEKDIRLETARRIHNVADLDQDQEAMILEEVADITQEDHTIQEIGEAMILAAEVIEEEEAEEAQLLLLPQDNS